MIHHFQLLLQLSKIPHYHTVRLNSTAFFYWRHVTLLLVQQYVLPQSLHSCTLYSNDFITLKELNILPIHSKKLDTSNGYRFLENHDTTGKTRNTCEAKKIQKENNLQSQVLDLDDFLLKTKWPANFMNRDYVFID